MHDVVDAADGVVAWAKINEVLSVAVHVPCAAAVDDELQPNALGSHVDLGGGCAPPRGDVEAALPGLAQPSAAEEAPAGRRGASGGRAAHAVG